MIEETRKVKRTRSRFGCNNCKKMKIKCDERKPQCSNCLKSKKYNNKCDYSIKLCWGGRPYKNKDRKKAMQNCGYQFDGDKDFLAQFVFSRCDRGVPSTNNKRNVMYNFINENEQITNEYSVTNENRQSKRPAANAKSVSYESNVASANCSTNCFEQDEIYASHIKRRKLSLSEEFNLFSKQPVSTDSESSIASNLDLGSFHSDNNSITSIGSPQHGKTDCSNPALSIVSDDSDSAIDVFRYDNSNFLERLRKTESAQEESQQNLQDAFLQTESFQKEDGNAFLPSSVVSPMIDILSTVSSSSKLDKLVEYYLTQSNLSKMTKDSKNCPPFDISDPLFVDNNSKKVKESPNSLYDSVKFGLANLVIHLQQRVGQALPQFTSATTESIMLNLKIPSFQLEEVPASSFFGKQSCQNRPEVSDNGLVDTFGISESDENIASIENFFTEVNYNDFFDFGLDSPNHTSDKSQIALPFAETENFWTSFTNICNDETCDVSEELVKRPGDYTEKSDYTDVYLTSPPGVLLLQTNVNTTSFHNDCKSAYDKFNQKAYYCYSQHLDTRISVSLLPYPDMLLNVSYYRELFHFYIHCVSDSMVNYKDEFYDRLCSGNESIIDKNPFKYQLPAIALGSRGILSILLAIAAAFRQFKANFEDLTFEDVGKLRTSSRTMASLEISKNSLSRYNYHKPIIQNLLSRSFYHLTENLKHDIKMQENIVLVYLFNYLEKITSKKLHFKLVDRENNLVYTALDLKFPKVEPCSSSIIKSHSHSYQLDEFIDYMISWFSTMAIISGCLVKSPNVNCDNVYKEDYHTDLANRLFENLTDGNIGGHTLLDIENYYGTNAGRVPHHSVFGLDTRLLGELYKVMQLSKEKWHLINKFRDLRRDNNLEFVDIFNINTGLIGTALALKNTLISKLADTINDLDKNDEIDTDIPKHRKHLEAKSVLKMTNKLYVYSALLILYRRVILVPRDSDISQRFSSEILKLLRTLMDMSDIIYGADSRWLTLFIGCLSFAAVCGALETLDFQKKKEALVKIFETSKRNFSLNLFLTFEIIQESYENCLPLSEIINKRHFRVHFA